MGHIIEVLNSTPSYDELVYALQAWTQQPVVAKTASKDGLAARKLVLDIIPSFWHLTTDDHVLERLLVLSLASLAGLNALLSQRKNPQTISILSKVLVSKELSPLSVHNALFETSGLDDLTAQQLWSNYVKLIAGGQIVGLVGEARITCSEYEDVQGIWLDDRTQYSERIAAGLVDAVNQGNIIENLQFAEHLGVLLDLIAALSSPSDVVAMLLRDVKMSESKLARVQALLKNCSLAMQPRIFTAVIQNLQAKYLIIALTRNNPQSLQSVADRIGAVATYINRLCGSATARHFTKVLLLDSGQFSISMRRSLILAYEKSLLTSLAEQCLERWADATFIRLVSVFDQEALTETILIVCAYVSATDLLAISKSKALVSGISNHLESTSERIRFLGMIVGETISAQVIADPAKRLSFGVPDTQTEEAFWWRALIELEDTMTDLSQLSAGTVEVPADPFEVTGATSKVGSLKISEVVDDSESSDDEFETMRVPDSDDEDSDEDPTLVDRERLHPPVYIRDLIKMINNHDSYKHVSLALHTAPALVRRKANFGTELKDYSVNLTQIFAGLRDNFDMDDFQALRQEALKALVVSDPTAVCPYLSQVLFTGDYSLQQRVIILTSLGLGARELAGLSDIPAHLRNLTVSKTLPSSVLQRYKTIEGVSEALQESILQPIAIDAAESLSGPAALKVNKTTRKLTTPKQQIINNRLTPLAADCILFPLLGRFAMHSGKMVDKNATTFYEAHLLQYYLRTVSLIYQASGKSPAISRLTLEFWKLLLSLRSESDYSVLLATLHGLLIIIDTIEPRQLAQEFSQSLVETQEWCTQIFEKVKDEKVQMISAGILIRIRDVVETHQMLMLQSVTMMGNIGRGRFGLAGLQ